MELKDYLDKPFITVMLDMGSVWFVRADKSRWLVVRRAVTDLYCGDVEVRGYLDTCGFSYIKSIYGGKPPRRREEAEKLKESNPLKMD